MHAYSLPQAERVSALPGKFLSFKSPIKIEFAQDVAGAKPNREDKRELITFQPAVKGKLVWTSRNQLEFRPERPLEKFRTYTGVLHLNTLFSRRDLTPLEFSFETLGNEVAVFEAEFKPAASGVKYAYVCQGRVELAEEVNLADLQISLVCVSAGKPVPIRIQGPEFGKRFEFQSQEIRKSDQARTYSLILKKAKLDLAADIDKDIVLEKREVFKVVKTSSLGMDEKKGVLAVFSDGLSKQQPKEGFVSVQPALAVKLKAVDNKLYIFGDFEIGKNYVVTIAAGLKSVWNDSLAEKSQTKLYLEDLKPQIRFTSPGVFLPSSNQNKITFQTVNVKKVRLRVYKVFASNLGQFLQTQKLASSTESYEPEELRRVGVLAKEQELVVGNQKNKWLTQALDLKEIFKQEEKGLFQISLAFTKADSLYQKPAEDGEARKPSNEEEEYGWTNDYYTDPAKHGYYDRNGTVSLPVILSDIGLTVKKADKDYFVFANDLKETGPMSGVTVQLKTFQNQVIAEKTTNLNGAAEFRNITQEVFCVEGQANNQRSVVKFSEMAWNLSGCDIGGLEIQPGGLRAYIFTDRGVYRPGDSIRLSLIARNQDGGFPDNHPVTVKFRNPKNQIMTEKILRQSRDGFYVCELKTQENDPTGEWSAELMVGASTFRKEIKVETVVPNRLKVEIGTDQERFAAEDKHLAIKVQSKYLFGTPASNLKTELAGSLETRELSFDNYPDFTFSHEAIEYKAFHAEIATEELDSAGELESSWTLPDLEAAPSGLAAQITARVYEKGGRYTQTIKTVAVDPYPRYVGLERPKLDYGYFQIPNRYETHVALVSPLGKPLSGSTLHYRLYKNERWWWWEYRDQETEKLKFKTNSTTELVASGTLISRKLPVPLQIKIEEEGQYLLEVQDGTEGHTAGYFFFASVWGSSAKNKQEAAAVILKADKEKYVSGETAVVTFPAPGQGRVLCTLERGNQVLKYWWENLDKSRKTCSVSVAITPDMVPNAYLSVSILQPHSQSKNDLPLRLYGVLPLRVENAGTKKELEIRMRSELKPEQAFEVAVQSKDHKPFQAVVAVVDVGLLDLTNFQTPDPWAYFYQKLRLGVSTFDLYSQVIGANKDDIFRLFSIGGGESITGQMNPVEAKRFKPVALFQGPLASDANGLIQAKFTMPSYLGAVRVMVVAADKMSFGSASQTVPVRKELMVQPTLPRVLGPGESFYLPVDVITMKAGVGAVTVKVSAQGPVSVDGEAQKIMTMNQPANELAVFKMKTEAALGAATVRVEARSRLYASVSTTEIAVRPSAPRISTTSEQMVEKDKTITVAIPNDGVLGSNEATLSVRRLPNLNFDHRLEWLVHYPYGCIEQTTSSVFPQLHLKAFLKGTKFDKAIDTNINAGISRLKSFVTPSGGFAYWPGGPSADSWGTNYAGHFLLEAKKLGYSVPDEMLANWLRFQHSMALKAEDSVLERVYRVYLLAMAGDPDMAAMNLLKENHLKNMSNPERWMFGAAYKLAGYDGVSREILQKAGMEVREYHETWGTYGSTLRDQAIILEALVLFNRLPEARRLFETLGANVSSEAWYSTQTVAYSLLAMGKYLQKLDMDYNGKKPRLVGWIQLPNGKKVRFDSQDLMVRQKIDQGFGQEAKVYLSPDTSLGMAYVNLDWSGVPLASTLPAEEKNLGLKVEWCDDEGNEVDPASVRQGKNFWGKITVTRQDNWERVDNVALVQVLPSGWEVENTRLTGITLPEWVQSLKTGQEDYLDIRDDRIMWFFNLRDNRWDEGNHYVFVFKVNAITAGTFQLPATLVEAMYDHEFRATTTGKKVTVEPGFKIKQGD
jgi:uncharacterized protein YfaS (alpha-2-macroglobulin family)